MINSLCLLLECAVKSEREQVRAGATDKICAQNMLCLADFLKKNKKTLCYGFVTRSIRVNSDEIRRWG